jgi:hypothetical protein
MLLFGTTTLALVLGLMSWAWERERQRRESFLTKALGGKESRRIIAAPDSVDVYLLGIPAALRERQLEPKDYVITKGPVRLAPETAAEISRLINESNSYDVRNDCKCALPLSRIRLRFRQGASEAWIDVPLHDGPHLVVHQGGIIVAGGHFEPGITEMLRTMQRVFPKADLLDKFPPLVPE